MRLPLFVFASPSVGDKSPKVMVPPGRWKLVLSDAELKVAPETSARQSDDIFTLEEVGFFQLTVEALGTHPAISAFLHAEPSATKD